VQTKKKKHIVSDITLPKGYALEKHVYRKEDKSEIFYFIFIKRKASRHQGQSKLHTHPLPISLY
jgi:hypothetical protein